MSSEEGFHVFVLYLPLDTNPGTLALFSHGWIWRLCVFWPCIAKGVCFKYFRTKTGTSNWDLISDKSAPHWVWKMDSLHFLCNTNKLPCTVPAAKFQWHFWWNYSLPAVLQTKALLIESFPLLSERNGPWATPWLLRAPGEVNSWLNFPTVAEFGPWFQNQTRYRAETRFHQADR